MSHPLIPGLITVIDVLDGAVLDKLLVWLGTREGYAWADEPGHGSGGGGNRRWETGPSHTAMEQGLCYKRRHGSTMNDVIRMITGCFSLIFPELKEWAEDTGRVQALCRFYGPGEVMARHTDRPRYGSLILGIIVKATDSGTGLQWFEKSDRNDTTADPVYRLEEEENLGYLMSGPSRTDYLHSVTKPGIGQSRWSITLRFFPKEKNTGKPKRFREDNTELGTPVMHPDYPNVRIG